VIDETPEDPAEEQNAGADVPAAEPLPEAAAEAPAEEPTAEAPADPEPEPADDAPAEPEPEPEPAAEPVAAAEPEAAEAPEPESDDDDEPATPRVKPAIPGADLEVDIVAEGADPLAGLDAEELDAAELAAAEQDRADEQPVAAMIDLAADARYRATGKRKTAVARVILRPGNGAYLINGKTLDTYFPRPALGRNIRQPLEAVGYDDRMDVVARMHGGGVSAQAGALRHGISRALLEADPNLRGELKRRGFLTRDSRAKERKKAGLKKARKKPQFSKR
jgi:small subunit ribosomal protein S9